MVTLHSFPHSYCDALGHLLFKNKRYFGGDRRQYPYLLLNKYKIILILRSSHAKILNKYATATISKIFWYSNVDTLSWKIRNQSQTFKLDAICFFKM